MDSIKTYNSFKKEIDDDCYLKNRKDNLRLDLTNLNERKRKFQSILTSPDLKMLKLASPELENLILSQPSLFTPTPSQYFFPKVITEDQEIYARGFLDALANIKQKYNTSSFGNYSGRDNIPDYDDISKIYISGFLTNSFYGSTFNQKRNKDHQIKFFEEDNIIQPKSNIKHITVKAFDKDNDKIKNCRYNNTFIPVERISSITNNNITYMINDTLDKNTQKDIILKNYSKNALSNPSTSQDIPESKQNVSDEKFSISINNMKKMAHNYDVQNVLNHQCSLTYAHSDQLFSPHNGNEQLHINQDLKCRKVPSPIDLESQEIIKIERKRLRNRIAASKCRKRKIERISDLEKITNELKDENESLQSKIINIKTRIENQKIDFKKHLSQGCNFTMSKHFIT